MMDPFLELKYGKIVDIDVHGKSIEDARAEVLYLLGSLDYGISGILVVHGFHKGTKIKEWLRHKFIDPRVIKIINYDAGSTLLLLAEDLAKL